MGGPASTGPARWIDGPRLRHLNPLSVKPTHSPHTPTQQLPLPRDRAAPDGLPGGEPRRQDHLAGHRGHHAAHPPPHPLGPGRRRAEARWVGAWVWVGRWGGWGSSGLVGACVGGWVGGLGKQRCCRRRGSLCARGVCVVGPAAAVSLPTHKNQSKTNKTGTKDGYSGYGAEQGVGALREKIATKLYGGRVAPDEVRREMGGGA